MPHHVPDDPGNWESFIFAESLSRRAGAVGGTAYWGAGANPAAPAPPVEPIVLTGGLPDDDYLPSALIQEATETVLRRETRFALQYGGPQGAASLREWLATEANRREGVQTGPENFSITNGAAGALANVCDTFLDPGDVVLVEAPTYPGFVRMARSCLAEVVTVPIDGDGILPGELEARLEDARRAGKRAKLLYTIANFQNPTSATMPLDRRQQVADVCRRHGVIIVEDDAYGDIRFEGPPLPSMYALTDGQGAIRVGTFSKTLAPGLRLGWTMASQEMTDALVRMRFDLGTSPLVQRVIAELCASGRFWEHVPQVVDLYGRKRDTMVSLLDERCSRYARWRIPEGGFFLWLELAEGLDPDALSDAAAEEGVGYVTGRAFHPVEPEQGARFIRLAYSQVPESDIPESIMRLGRAMERAAGR